VPRLAPLLALLLVTRPSSAAALRVTVESCPPSLSRGLERFVTIELEPLTDEGSETDVEVSCSDDNVVLLVSLDGRTQTRSMDLRTIAPSVRGRVVALTAAELVRELGAAPPPEPEPTAPAVIDRPSPGPAHRPTPVGELEAFFQSAQIDTLGDVLVGGGLRFAYSGARPWRLALDFGASTFQRTSPIGTARLILAGLGARAGYTVPLGGELGLELGGGGRVGVARISGTPADDEASAASVAGAWSAPLAFVGLEAPLARFWRLGLDLEVGYVLVPVRGRIEGGDDVNVDGLWTSLSLGIAVEL